MIKKQPKPFKTFVQEDYSKDRKVRNPREKDPIVEKSLRQKRVHESSRHNFRDKLRIMVKNGRFDPVDYSSEED